MAWAEKDSIKSVVVQEIKQEDNRVAVSCFVLITTIAKIVDDDVKKEFNLQKNINKQIWDVFRHHKWKHIFFLFPLLPLIDFMFVMQIHIAIFWDRAHFLLFVWYTYINFF